MFEHELVRADYRWDITAFELYLYRSGVWPDETAHGFNFGIAGHVSEIRNRRFASDCVVGLEGL
jgi:hypothetical protein